MEETHKILDGKVNLYRRGKSQIWQCSTYLEGKICPAPKLCTIFQ